jgi:TonB-linked SusC/RagA family outer membrane protein
MEMKKNLLLNSFNSSKKIILVFLLTIFTCLASFAQTRQITGTVTADGSPVPGASVVIKGTSTGTTTDANGNFRLTVSNNTTLTISFIGYDTRDIKVGSENNIKVTLQSNTGALNEVVVIGYGTSKRKDLTGAVSSISAATIAKKPVVSVDEALQGRAAGVQVTANDGAPGGNFNVLIRGTGSVALYGNGPLYVVDGYPLEAGGINNVNPADIATIDVLKDASATAIYGIRAANGVVIITTKKGKAGTTVISFDGYDAFQSPPKKYDVLNADQFATLANQVAAASNGTFQSFANWADPDTLHNVNWQNALYRTGLTQSYTLSIRGGSDKTQSSTSIGYYDQKGIVLGAYFQRITLNNNTDYQPTKWLRSSTNVKYSYQSSNTPLGTGNLLQLSELPPTLDGGNPATNQINDGHGNYGFFNPIYVYVAKYSNPEYAIYNDVAENISNYLVGSTSLEATIVDGLKVKTNAGVTYDGFSGSYLAPEDDRLVNAYGAQAGATQNGSYSQNINSVFDWLWENTISYDKTFGKHTINFVGGVSEQDRTYNIISGSGVPPNGITRDLSQDKNAVFTQNLPGTPTQQQTLNNGQDIQTLASQFARLSYNYDEKYFITGTVRRDGSSKFAPGHNYGVFPSGAVSWNAKKESFLKDIDWLSSVKFRGSYGEVGNEATIADYQYQSLYASGGPQTVAPNYGYTFGNPKTYAPGIYNTQPENDDLHWETDKETDIGGDFGFLHNDLSLTVDWFNRISDDFLLNVPTSIQSGFPSQTANVGSMDNKGLETALNYTHTNSNGFQYGGTLTITTVYNRLTGLYKGSDALLGLGSLSVPALGWSEPTRTLVGQEVGEFYGYKSLGIFQSQAQIDALNKNAVAHGFQYYQNQNVRPGDRYFADVNGDGTVNASDMTDLGSPLPKFYGGLNLDASYKNFDINLYFYGEYGNKIFDFAESSLESFQNRSFVGVENISEQYLQNAWTPQNHSNTYARITANDDAIGDNVASSQYIENGSYLKLKNATIGYTFPKSVISKIGASKLRVYFSTQNLFTITKYKGLDPELGTTDGSATQNGIDIGTYPSSRFYTLGLNLTL